MSTLHSTNNFSAEPKAANLPAPMKGAQASVRTMLFISKATPGDDAFALWLAPRLEAAGYRVFADILELDTGDHWRRKLTTTLQESAVKMLLCCSNETLARNGVLEEISIALELSRSLADENFILPLKIRRYNPVFGIANLQYTDFEVGWAEGLSQLLKSLKRQNVPKFSEPSIQSEWAAYHRRRAVVVRAEPEVLTSNWLRILSVPDQLHFIGARGAMKQARLKRALMSFPYPHVPLRNGLITFANPLDCAEWSEEFKNFHIEQSITYSELSEAGWPALGIEPRDAGNMITSLLRQAWVAYCRKVNLLEHTFSNSTAFLASDPHVAIGQRVPWGRQGARRNSMLRNIARGKLWEYGVSAHANLFPFPHFRLKSRVLFSEVNGMERTGIVESTKAQHRLRRSVCSSWRNKAWHGRLMAFMELLAGESPYLNLKVGSAENVLVDAMPIQATSPVSARQTNKLGEDAEETDVTTLIGGYQQPDQEDGE
ncbi:MAG: toll/interleukin-1 receptor domain-containing protein [Devosia sp.]